MAIEAGWCTVCGPSCVCDTGVVVENLGQIWLLLLDQLLEHGDLSDFLECKDFVLLVAIDGETSRVISTVFETGETW